MSAVVIAARALCAVVALVLLVVIAERMMPLRSVSRDRWEWDLRPGGRFPAVDRAGWTQIAVFTVFGAGIGGLLRYIVGVRKPRRLPVVLAGGTTRTMTAVSPTVFDSESAADIYAATWLKDAPVRSVRRAAPVLPMLMLRRVLRRGYVPLLFLVVALLAAAVVPYTGIVGRVLLALAWSVLASAVWRATRLGVPGEWRWRSVILAVVSLAGAVVLWLPGVPAHPVQATMWVLAAVVWCALVRGRPRENTNFLSVDVGMGAPVPLGMLRYWMSGLLAVVPAVAAAVAAVGF
ncbi:hypothetical protein [uncultured Corynebacterium sp.]|uniref:hypothetical protein n=1 Tax=uncultured Corynebacterium sp. TaxID=159447 RepID=UPI0025DBF34A|nr:hypothetical protein [uncultured Corynebacterium sp.]